MKAGRKSISKVDRRLIGARIESEWLALGENRSMQRHREKIDHAGVEEARQKLRELPLSERSLVLKAENEWSKLEEAAPLGKRPSEPALIEKLPAKIAEAVRQLHHLVWDELNGRQRFVTMRKPQGELDDLISRIAADEGAKRGITITESQARHWHENYRAWCKKLNFGES